jgi:fumarate reductase flavoprotein subunit
MSAPAPNVPAAKKQADDEAARTSRDFIRKMDGKERVNTLRTEMNKAMEDGCGIYRTEASIQATCEKMMELRERFRNLGIDDHSNSFNTDLTAALELDYMLDCALAMCFSALQRKESRGAHQRIDFPQRDDVNFLRHSMAHRTDGAPRIDYKPVTITKWPPAERVYGK